jgi:aspartate/methionine/tyrosine aminotransferase
VLLKPGDHCIVTYPGYQSLYQIAEAVGAEVTKWWVQPVTQNGVHNWDIDLDALRAMIKPNTRLIVVNFPHNPTGALPDPAQWRALVDIAREQGCYLFSDEVYRLLEYHEEDRLPAAVDLYDKALSLGVLSKPFALAGLRIGWLALQDEALMAEMASYKDYTTICNSAPAEILGLIALRNRQTVLDRSLRLIRKNLVLAEAFMHRQEKLFEWVAPRAGSVAFPKWKGQGSSDQFCQTLVNNTGVLLLPSSVYGYPEQRFRMGLGRENFPQAIERLEAFLKNSPEEI